MVKAIQLQFRSDDGNNSVNIADNTYDGVTINFDISAATHFENGYTSGNIISTIRPPNPPDLDPNDNRSEITYIAIDGNEWKKTDTNHDGDNIRSISLKGKATSSPVGDEVIVPLDFSVTDEVLDLSLNLHWGSHSDNTSDNLKDNFSVLKLIDISSSGNEQVFSLDLLTGAFTWKPNQTKWTTTPPTMFVQTDTDLSGAISSGYLIANNDSNSDSFWENIHSQGDITLGLKIKEGTWVGVKRGDVTGDGAIEVGDLTFLANFINSDSSKSRDINVYITELTDKGDTDAIDILNNNFINKGVDWFSIADVNNDGNVEVVDLTYLANAMKGLKNDNGDYKSPLEGTDSWP